MKYIDAVTIMEESIYKEVYIEEPAASVIYSKEVRAYKHPQKELFLIIQEFRDNLHFIKAYGSVHVNSKLVTKTYYGAIITHAYDNGEFQGMAVLMDGYRGCNLQLFIDFLDKHINQFEDKMHSLPVMYLQVTAGANTKKQETILKNLGLEIKNRDFYFSIPHAMARDKINDTKLDFEKDLE
jgi:hypothetical protein